MFYWTALHRRSLVLHVCLPGQEASAPDLTTFPELSVVGLGLVSLLDHLRLGRVVVLGTGAGANIAARFALSHPSRVHGQVPPAALPHSL